MNIIKLPENYTEEKDVKQQDPFNQQSLTTEDIQQQIAMLEARITALGG